MRCPSRDRRRRQRPYPRNNADSKRENEDESSAHAKMCISRASKCQEVRVRERKPELFFPENRNQLFYLLIKGKEKSRNILTFAFCSPIVRDGRGNGKRVAFSSIANLA